MIYKTNHIVFFAFLIIFLSILLSPQSSSLNIYPKMQNEICFRLKIGQNISMLQPGDIAFKHPDIFPAHFPTIIDHCLLYVGYNNSTNMYGFIEASMVDARVQYRFETESALTESLYGPFARVKNANETQKQNAIDFAKRQLGKSFQGEWINKNYNPEDTVNDSLADEWYCSELIWAAYYNCNNPFPKERPENGYIYGEGIDLDRNGWNKNLINYTVVTPREILKNRNEVRIYHFINHTYSGLLHHTSQHNLMTLRRILPNVLMLAFQHIQYPSLQEYQQTVDTMFSMNPKIRNAS